MPTMEMYLLIQLTNRVSTRITVNDRLYLGFMPCSTFFPNVQSVLRRLFHSLSPSPMLKGPLAQAGVYCDA